MNLDIEGKIAIVTGGSSGIGEAIAKVLISEGCIVVTCARKFSKLESAYRASLEVYGQSKILLMECDVHCEVDCEHLVQKVLQTFGAIHILVNNSEGPDFSWDIGNIPDDDWLSAFQGKLESYIRMIRLVMPSMEKNGWGRIVNLAGLAGREPSIPLIKAGVVNAGITNFSKTMSRYAAPSNILINTVNPGIIETSRFHKFAISYAKYTNQDVAEVEKLLLDKIPLARLGYADEVANLVAFLVSERSSYITGESFVVDGGMSVLAI